MRQPLLRRRGTSDHLSGMAAPTEDDSNGQHSSQDGGGAHQEPSPLPSRTGSAAGLQAATTGLRPTPSLRRVRPPSGLAGAGGSRQGSVVNLTGQVAPCSLSLLARPLQASFLRSLILTVCIAWFRGDLAWTLAPRPCAAS